MGFLFDIKKKILEKELAQARKVKIVKERKLKEAFAHEQELNRLKKQLQEAKTIKMSPAQQKAIKDKAIRRKQALEKTKKDLIGIKRGFDKFLDVIEGSPKKKKRTTKRKRR